MTRWTFSALTLMLLLLAAVLSVAVDVRRRDRERLLKEFADNRLGQVKQAAQIMENDLEGIAKDLEVMGELVETSRTLEDRGRELRAMLNVSRAYHRIDVQGERGPLLRVERDGPAPSHATVDELILHTMKSAVANPRVPVQTTPPIATGDGRWSRVFAKAVALQHGGPRVGAVAVLVDTEPLFGKLRLVASDSSSRLLLLGVHGQPTPVSDPVVAMVVSTRAEETPRMAAVADAMRAGQSGTTVLPSSEATLLGLGDEPVVVAHASVNVGDKHWAIATLNSTGALAEQERTITTRIVLTAGAVGLCLVAFAIYLFVSSRRALVVRERLRHAEQLAHLLEKTEKILDTIPTGVLVLGATGVVTSANRVIRENLKTQNIHGTLDQVFPDAPPTLMDRLRSLVEAAVSSDRVRSFHGERMSLFGHEGQYSIHAVPLEPRFPGARALLVIEDLSEVRSLASQLLRAEKLATVGVLAAGVAHEIGTPLGIVRGRAQNTLKRLGGDHPQAPALRIIVEQIDAVSRTIRQLLDFSRVRPALAAPMHIAQVVRGVAELLQLEAERRKVVLKVDVSDALPVIAGDADQVQQMLVNLTMNALDACQPGGKVRISAQADERRDEAGWSHLRIMVVDNGCGVPENLRAQVFDPFFTTKKRGQGTGLGLTIAAQIVRNHGGQIELDSTLGHGTTVTVRWPTKEHEGMQHDGHTASATADH
ncbi:MAG: ATP-binding protein [Myxococcota bacterium]